MWDEFICAVVWAFFGIAFLGLEWKLTFSSPVATAEFSKFAILTMNNKKDDNIIIIVIIYKKIHSSIFLEKRYAGSVDSR